MTEKTSSRRRRGVAVAGALALGFAGLFGGTAANAADYGNIDFENGEGSITVHKHEYQTNTSVTGDPESGGALPNPIKGVVFTAYPITSIDLEDNDGWAALGSIDATSAADCAAPSLDGHELGAGLQFDATGTDGSATLDVDLGAYLICETDTSAVANPGIEQIAQPFIVTVPFPDSQDGASSNSDGWLYDVHVFPKNVMNTSVVKTISAQDGYGIGSTIEFPVDATIPRIPAEDRFTEFYIIDDMDDRFGDTPRIVSVELDGTEINDTLYETTDANPLKVWFNLAGLQHLKDNAGSTVTVTFAGELQSVGDGNISNVASYRVNHAPIEYPEDCDPTADDCDPTVPEEPKEPGDPDPDCEENCDPTTPEVNTYWGDLKINKVDAGDGSTGLTGAEFKVFEASDPYATDCATTTQGDEVTFGIDDNDNEITRVFTSEDGEVHVDGLYISDSENENSQQARCYWIEETAAPTGYQLDPEPAQAVTVNVGTTSGIDLTIKNTKQEVPELPLTGGQGTALLIGGGAALIALGAVLYVVRRRKSAQL